MMDLVVGMPSRLDLGPAVAADRHPRIGNVYLTPPKAGGGRAFFFFLNVPFSGLAMSRGRALELKGLGKPLPEVFR